MIKLIFVIFHPSYYNQVEPAISKQVEFLNGYMHADDAWHVFTNNIRGENLSSADLLDTYPWFSNVLTGNFLVMTHGLVWGI